MANALSNPGFEDALGAIWATHTEGGGTVTRVSGNHHLGAYCLRCYAESSAAERNYGDQAVACTPGYTGVLSAWATGDGNQQWEVWDNTNGVAIMQWTSIAADESYQQFFTEAFVIPAGCVSLSIRLNSGNAGNNVYWDDVDLEFSPPVSRVRPRSAVWFT
jgi:hypothetical protein